VPFVLVPLPLVVPLVPVPPFVPFVFVPLPLPLPVPPPLPPLVVPLPGLVPPVVPPPLPLSLPVVVFDLGGVFGGRSRVVSFRFGHGVRLGEGRSDFRVQIRVRQWTEVDRAFGSGVNRICACWARDGFGVGGLDGALGVDGGGFPI
jgi:hypothetical protein